MKRGPFIVKLEIDVTQALVFPIKAPRGAKLVHGIALVTPPKVMSKNSRPQLGAAILCFDADLDETESERLVVLIPPSGWIAEDGAEHIGVIVNPIDGAPLFVYEVPMRAAIPVPEATAPMRSARPILDVPSQPLTSAIEPILPDVVGEIDTGPAAEDDTVH